MNGPRRILAVDSDPALLEALRAHLLAAGFAFEGLRESARAVPLAKTFEPHLLLIDRSMPILSGGEVIRSLRSFPETVGTPVAFLVSDTSARELVRSLRAGAVDVIQKPTVAECGRRLHDLLDDLLIHRTDPRASADEQVVGHLLRFFRRERRTGVLQVNPGTPFEGRATFADGELKSAEYGPLEGTDALREMVQLEDGVWRFGAPVEGSVRRPPPLHQQQVPTRPDLPSLKAAEHYRPRILVVDDDVELRRLFRAQLIRAGFEVEVASDGLEGAQAAGQSVFDLVLADLNMPRLDGWGMLKILKEDHRTRELPVVFLSAHDDYRETLRAARSGAHDYLAKTGRAEDVVQRLLTLLSPRLEAMQALRAGQQLSVSANVLGIQWLLRALASLRLTGLLDLREEWAHYLVSVKDGAPVEARVTWPKRQATGVPAMASLVVSNGAEGLFTPGPVMQDPRLNMTMEALLQKTCDMLNQLEARVTTTRLATAESFVVDEELYELYRRVGSDRGARLARAICEERMRPADVAGALNMPPQEVQDGLKELLRRGVISFSDFP